MVQEGRIRVPHFQRGLRWGTTDVVALIDSVLRGYPIGSLLLWKRKGPQERFMLGQVSIDAPEMGEALYVVDGQQRITSFINAFDAAAGLSGPFALVYDLKERPFRVRARRGDEHDAIPLPVLFDLSQLLRWTSANPQYQDIIDEVNAATTRLREFHVPAYEVRSEDDKALRHIYDRMNNAGKRLSRAEAFWGLFAPDELEKDPMSLQILQDHVLTSLNWGRIDDDTLLSVFLARRGHDVSRDIHLEFDDARRPKNDFPGESEEQAHQQALEALDRAVRFLRDDAGVPHFSFLAYRYLLVVLARYFALFPNPNERNRELIRRWYWQAALAGPGVARGSATGAMRMLCACIQKDQETASTQRLLEAVKNQPRLLPNPKRFRANHSASHVMLCALWAIQPVSPDTGLPFTPDDLAQELVESSSPNSVCIEVFSRLDLGRELSQSIGNRVLMPGIPVESVRARLLGEQLFHTPSDQLLHSHLFERGDTDIRSAAEVVRSREARFSQALDAFLATKTGEGLEDTPPLESFDFDSDDDDDDDDDDDEHDGIF
jgi:hypothetical protein